MNTCTDKYSFLKNIFNISVSKSADILSEIIQKKINLKVPELNLIDLKENRSEFYNYIDNVGKGSILFSSLSFNKEIKGKANLIFPSNKMKSFVSLCMNEDDNCTFCDLNFTDVDFDVLREIGNIILNSIINEIGNYVNVNLEYTLPEVNVMNNESFEKMIVHHNFSKVLLLHITFSIDDRDIAGAILINLTLNSLDGIFDKANRKGSKWIN